MISKTEKALKDFEFYLRQQRKQNVVIYTNDKKMKRLLEKLHPNAIVEYLEMPKPSETEHKPLGVMIYDDYIDRPNPLIFKPFYRMDDSPNQQGDNNAS